MPLYLAEHSKILHGSFNISSLLMFKQNKSSTWPKTSSIQFGCICLSPLPQDLEQDVHS